MRYLIPLLALSLISGCASVPSNPETGPRIDRITPEELEHLAPPAPPTVTLEEIVQMSASGATPEAIIEKLRGTQSRYTLTPTRVIELHGKGVPAKVLDAIDQDQRRQALEDMADEVNRREREHHEEIEALQRRLLLQPGYCDPFWPSPYWYNRYPYRRW